MLLMILISGSSNVGYNSRSDRAQRWRQVMVMAMKISLLSFQISSFWMTRVEHDSNDG
jgi:hypothetical protein